MAELVWELIKKMNAYEKAFFKKQYNVQLNSENRIYLKIFNKLNAQSVYNEKEFGKEFGNSNQISRMKNYLNELLLSSLVSYNSNSDNYLKSKKHLSYARLLYYKGMISQSKRQLIKTIRICKENIDFYSELESWSYLRKIYHFELDEELFNSALIEEQNIFYILSEIQDFERLHFEISNIAFNRGNILSNENLQKYNQIISHPRFDDVEKCSSIIAVSYFYRIRTMYDEMTKNMQNFYKNALLRYETLKETNYFSVFVWEHINTLNNLIESCLFLDKYEEANNYSQLLFDIETNSVYLDARKQIRYVILFLHNSLASKKKINLDDLDIIVKRTLEIPTLLIRKDERVEILALMAILYFNQRSYKGAKKYINEFNKLPKSKARIDLQIYFTIISYFIYFHTDDLEYLSYLLKKNENLLFKEKAFNKFELKLIQFLKLEIPKKQLDRQIGQQFSVFNDEFSISGNVINNYNIGKYINFN